MGDAFEGALEAGLQELGLSAGPAGSARARRSYELHARLLREWGAAINLTAIREPTEIARRHVCDSLSAVHRLARIVRPGAALLDLGSGAGYPGLPLAAALPLGRVALLDSVGKKARFLAVAATAVHEALVHLRAGCFPRRSPGTAGRRTTVTRSSRSSRPSPSGPRTWPRTPISEAHGTSSRLAPLARWPRSWSWPCRSPARVAGWWPGNARRSMVACARSFAMPAPSSAPPVAVGPRSSSWRPPAWPAIASCWCPRSGRPLPATHVRRASVAGGLGQSRAGRRARLTRAPRRSGPHCRPAAHRTPGQALLRSADARRRALRHPRQRPRPGGGPGGRGRGGAGLGPR